MFSWFYGVWKLENIFQRENVLLNTGTDISQLISLVSRSKDSLALKDLIPLRKVFGVDAISMLGNGYLYLL
ncbi:hypothetical protein PVK06_040264 [Gossypium arboreum]|uniref:Uncharacterized protein n=1 Tax=Gossypium arboreum TaxID=29729 RepID=A0ABR0N5A2_GOSAR|nr:hypothetical protein PVK06_040264 [Gossypium arboreum]